MTEVNEDEEIARGIAAARAIFANAGITAWDAALARFKRDNYIKCLDAETRISHLWDDAVDAAAQAFRAGRAEAPRAVDLDLVQ
jgi:hypothetical protein